MIKFRLGFLPILNKSNYKLIIDELDNFFDLGVHNFSVNYFLPPGRGRFSDLRLSSEEMFYTYKSILDKLANKLKKDNILIFEKNMYYFIKKMITKKILTCVCLPLEELEFHSLLCLAIETFILVRIFVKIKNFRMEVLKKIFGIIC